MHRFFCANKAMLHYEICVQLIEIIKNNDTDIPRVFWHLKLKSIRSCSIFSKIDE
jgi:lipid-A-disaccharide synthase-like uncharacterized protein